MIKSNFFHFQIQIKNKNCKTNQQVNVISQTRFLPKCHRNFRCFCFSINNAKWFFFVAFPFKIDSIVETCKFDVCNVCVTHRIVRIEILRTNFFYF